MMIVKRLADACQDWLVKDVADDSSRPAFQIIIALEHLKTYWKANEWRYAKVWIRLTFDNRMQGILSKHNSKQ